MTKKIQVDVVMNDGEIHSMKRVNGDTDPTLQDTIDELSEAMDEGGSIAFYSHHTGSVVITPVSRVKRFEVHEVTA